jgi:DNA-binding NtrC family response regulator
MPDTVLIVDEPREAKAARSMLADTSYRVLIAGTGEQALEILHSQTRIELVAAEVLLPGAVSSAALISKIRLSYPTTAVMLMTSQRERPSNRAVPILVKPFTASLLAHRVECLLKENRQMAESLSTAFEWNRAAKGELETVRRTLQANIRQSRQQRADRFVAGLRQPGATIPTILVAEDNAVFRYALCRFLARCGFRVLDAANGEHALSVSRGHDSKIDLVLVDMPVSGGAATDLVDALANERPDAQVILMTVGEIAHRGHMLRKPFELEDLLAEIVGRLTR